MPIIRGIKRLPRTVFARIPNGTEIRNHDFYVNGKRQPGNQCVALVNLYHEGVRRLPFIPIDKAVELWTRRRDLDALRLNYTGSQTPVRGAIAVWEAAPENGFAGHTGVVAHVYTRGRRKGLFNTREQNWGTGKQRWLYKYRRSLSDPTLLGFLNPKAPPQ